MVRSMGQEHQPTTTRRRPPRSPRPKARAVAKPDTAKPSNPSEPNDRMSRLEAKMSQITEQLQKLSETALSQKGATAAPLVPSDCNPSPRRQDTRTTVSAEEIPQPTPFQRNGIQRPAAYNAPPLLSQPIMCYGCGLPGHIKRYCPMNSQGTQASPPGRNLYNRGIRRRPGT